MNVNAMSTEMVPTEGELVTRLSFAATQLICGIIKYFPGSEDNTQPWLTHANLKEALVAFLLEVVK